LFDERRVDFFWVFLEKRRREYFLGICSIHVPRTKFIRSVGYIVTFFHRSDILNYFSISCCFARVHSTDVCSGAGIIENFIELQMGVCKKFFR